MKKIIKEYTILLAPIIFLFIIIGWIFGGVDGLITMTVCTLTGTILAILIVGWAIYVSNHFKD